MNRTASITALSVILGYPSLFGQTPLPNPDLPQKCPYDIIFVLDESGSIVGSLPGTSVISPEIRSGASALINSLNGTGSRVAVVEFNSTSRRAEIGGSTAYQTINNNYVTAFNTYITLDNNNTPTANRYDPEDNQGSSGWTNWEAALNTVRTINANEGIADLVIFFTDGNPTAYNYFGGFLAGSDAATMQQALNRAIVAANSVKTQGSHIFVVGVPNPSLPEPNVQAVSGPDKYPSPESDFRKGDYTISNSSTLQQDLAALAALLTPVVAQADADYDVTWTNHCDTFIVEFINKSTGASAYYWDFGDGSFSSDSSLTHIFRSGGPFVVRFIAYHDGDCGINDTLYDTLSFALTLDTLWTDFSYRTTSGCDSLLVEFTGTSSESASFYWDFDNGQTASGSNASVVYTTPGTYDISLIITPNDHCYETDTVVKPFEFIPVFDSAQAGFSYTYSYKNDCDTFIIEFTNNSTGVTDYYWDFGDGSFATDTNLTHLFDGGGPFVVMLAANNGGECGVNDTLYDTLSFALVFDTMQTELDYAYTPDCDSLLVHFTGASSSAATFTWDFGNGSSATGSSASTVYLIPDTTYYVTMAVTPTEGCYLADVKVDSVTFTPLAYASLADFHYETLYENYCDTFVVQFFNRSSGGTSYLWDFGNGITSTDTNATVTYGSGDYYVTLQVNDSRKCSTNDTLIQPLSFVPIITYPVADFDYRVSPNCDIVELELTNLGSGAERFIWRMNGNIISDFAPNAAFTYHEPAELNVALFATGANNCAVNDTAEKIVSIPAPYGYPVADFDFSPRSPETDQMILFTNLSQRADTTRYDWSFGDGNYSTRVNPQHAYAEKGNYEICLDVENEHGCPASVCKRTEVIYTTIVELPTAFTPNGDDHNDIFIVRGKDIVKMRLRIFNRWGELVFESHDPYYGWDGIYKGELQEMEVYDWLLNATLKNGQEIFRKGNVTLLR